MAKITAKHSKFCKLICAGTFLALLLAAQSASTDQSQSNANPCTHQLNSVQSGKSESTCHKIQSNWIELPDDAVKKLKIDAGFGWGIFSGTIYNGNESYHVTQLIVSMVPIHGHHHMDMHVSMSHDPKIHQINQDLAPLSKGALSMPIPNEDVHIHDFKWEIIKVMGYQTH